MLNERDRISESDLYLYDLVHPLFLNSMGELGTENFMLSLIKNNPQSTDNELIKMGKLARGTFYKYKKILLSKGTLISHR